MRYSFDFEEDPITHQKYIVGHSIIKTMEEYTKNCTDLPNMEVLDLYAKALEYYEKAHKLKCKDRKEETF